MFPEKTAAHLANVTPNILLLSEFDNGMARTGQRHTAEVIASQYSFRVELHELVLVRNTERVFFTKDLHMLVWHGHKILLSVPFVQTALVRLDNNGYWFSSGGNAVDLQLPHLGGRMTIKSVVPNDIGLFCLVSTHLESNAVAVHRQTQMQILRNTIDTIAPICPS